MNYSLEEGGDLLCKEQFCSVQAAVEKGYMI